MKRKYRQLIFWGGLAPLAAAWSAISVSADVATCAAGGLFVGMIYGLAFSGWASRRDER